MENPTQEKCQPHNWVQKAKSRASSSQKGTLFSPAWLNCSQCKPPHLANPRQEAQAFLNCEFTKLDSGRECRKREADCVDLGLLKASTEQNRGALVLRVPGPGCEPGHCWEILPYSAFWEAGCTQWVSEDVFPHTALRKALKPLQGVTVPERPPPCGTWALHREESWERSCGSTGSEQLQRNLFLYLPDSCWVIPVGAGQTAVNSVGILLPLGFVEFPFTTPETQQTHAGVVLTGGKSV